MLHDHINNNAILQALSAQVITADADGTTIDLQDATGVFFTVVCGESGDTLSGSVYINLTLQGAPDDGTGSPGTFVDITDAKDVVGATIAAGGVWALIDAAAEDDQVYSIGYIGASGEYRFVRIQVDVTGTHTNGTPMAAIAVLNPKKKPATNT